MNSGTDYLTRTSSATRKLFEGVESYLDPLRKGIIGAVFVSEGSDPATFSASYSTWAEMNSRQLEQSKQTQEEFVAELFAMAALCGAILEIAHKGIQMHSITSTLSGVASEIVGESSAARQFAIGREVKGVPIGLIIYAGRNQHAHFDEAKLSRVNHAVFDHLARVPGFEGVKDPAVDLARHPSASVAHNVTYLLGWRDFAAYSRDMESLLTRT